jgi:hypothetical protein
LKFLIVTFCPLVNQKHGVKVCQLLTVYMWICFPGLTTLIFWVRMCRYRVKIWTKFMCTRIEKCYPVYIAHFIIPGFNFFYRVDNLYISNFPMNTEHPNLTPLTNCLKCFTPLTFAVSFVVHQRINWSSGMILPIIAHNTLLLSMSPILWFSRVYMWICFPGLTTLIFWVRMCRFRVKTWTKFVAYKISRRYLSYFWVTGKRVPKNVHI